MKYLITITYDGSKFHGFQKLNNELTVQGELERSLSIINKKKVSVKGAGRTDRGVHAINQKCHFNLDINIDTKSLKKAINDRINKYIYIKNCVLVPEDFHARFGVVKKTYIYIINLGELDPLVNDYVYNLNNDLNIKEMKKAAKLFYGEQSLKNFVSGKRNNYDCNIYAIKFSLNNNYLYIKIVGKSFYRYMVRNIVGSLIYVGLNKITLLQINDLINNKTSKILYSPAPVSGLYLEDVEY